MIELQKNLELIIMY